jgi:hypothetical protein
MDLNEIWCESADWIYLLRKEPVTGSCKRDIGTSISITDGEICIRLVTVSFSI